MNSSNENDIKLIGADSDFKFLDSVVACPGCGTRGECIVINGTHWKVWTPVPPDILTKFAARTSAEQVVSAWQRILGIKPDVEQVKRDLEKFSQAKQPE